MPCVPDSPQIIVATPPEGAATQEARISLPAAGVMPVFGGIRARRPPSPLGVCPVVAVPDERVLFPRTQRTSRDLNARARSGQGRGAGNPGSGRKVGFLRTSEGGATASGNGGNGSLRAAHPSAQSKTARQSVFQPPTCTKIYIIRYGIFEQFCAADPDEHGPGRWS